MKDGNMKTQSRISTVLALGSLVVMATACGNFNTNPVSDYQDLKDAKQQPLEAKKQEQPVRPVNVPHLFVVLPDAGEQVLNFVEGQSSQYVLESRSIQDGISYTLTALNLPEGATFAPANDPKKPGAYTLSWAPKAGTLRKTEKGHRDIRFQIRVDIASVADASIANLVQYENGTTAKYVMHLYSTGSDAQILGFKRASDQVVQGEADAVTVEVTDPAAGEKQLPVLQVADDKVVSSELGIVKIASLVKFDAPVAQDGKFVIQGKFDSTDVKIPKGKNEVTGRFNVRVVSAAGGEPSPWQSIEIKILRKPDPTPQATQTSPAPAATPEVPKKAPAKTPTKGSK
jgi:hypothetical protein